VVFRSIDEWGAIFSSVGMRTIRYETSSLVTTHVSALNLLQSIHRTGAITPRKTSPATLRDWIARTNRKMQAGVLHAHWILGRIECERIDVK
jgi:hypothetical protein